MPLVSGGVPIGPREQEAPLRDAGIARPDLVAVDDPAVAVPLSPRRDGGKIGASARLRKALAPDFVASQDGRQIAPLLFLGADRQDQRTGQLHPRDVDGFGRCDPAQLLADDQMVEIIEALSAVLPRPVDAVVTGLMKGPLPDLAQPGGLVEIVGAAERAPPTGRQVRRNPRTHLRTIGLFGGRKRKVQAGDILWIATRTSNHRPCRDGH